MIWPFKKRQPDYDALLSMEQRITNLEIQMVQFTRMDIKINERPLFEGCEPSIGGRPLKPPNTDV